MKPWTAALVWPILLELTAGFEPPFAPWPSNSSSKSERASVAAGECLESPSTITIPPGDYAVFSSPNYPSNYDCFKKCSWKFQTDASHHLSLSCDPVYLSWFASLYVIDMDTKYEKNCILCGQLEKYQYKFGSNIGTVGLQNNFWFTGKGFSCRISSVPKPSNSGCSCGVINTNRIVGGAETAANEYPWMVLLVRPGGNANFCGGSLITDEFVLTAAHCTDGTSASNIQVRLGIHNKLVNPSGSLRRNVLQIIQHPSFQDSNNDYDASLLRISAVFFADHPTIRPICLPAGSDSYDGQQAITAGWGTTTAGGYSSSVLMDVTVPVISNTQCNSLLNGKVTSTMLCAGSKGLDSCQGDSGGPLFLSGGSGYQVIIGIVSWGYGCGDEGFPGVYGRVTVFKSWIDANVAGSTVCSPP